MDPLIRGAVDCSHWRCRLHHDCCCCAWISTDQYTHRAGGEVDSSATTLDLRSSVCIRLMDTSLHSHTLYLNTDWELPKTRWLDHELTPLPRPQLHAWAWSPTSSEGRQGIRVFVSSPTQGRGGWRSVSKGHPPRPSATSWITWLASRCLLCFLSFLRIESETLLQLSILLHV